MAAVGSLPEIHAVGGLSARRTAPDQVHMIGTAATPLGGDELDIRIVVGAGARLTVRSVAATIALPSAATPLSSAHWHFEIGEDAELDFDPEPTIIAGGAQHHALSTVRLASNARVRIRERVQIGRTGENSGAWRGDLIADVGDIPLLRHRLHLGSDSATDDPISAPRALDSELRYPDARTAEAHGLDGVLLPLAAGGSLYTHIAHTLAAERAPNTAAAVQ